MRVHLDADFLIYAVARGGPERERLRELVRSDAILQMSAVAWYEFARGPRTPEQLALARGQLEENDGVVELSEALAVRAADAFRALEPLDCRWKISGPREAVGFETAGSTERRMAVEAYERAGWEGTRSVPWGAFDAALYYP
jgi:hypothetical protein